MKKLWRYVKPFSSDAGTLRTDGRAGRRTDRQTDRQTDWQDLLHQYRASVCWRAIKIIVIITNHLVKEFWKSVHILPKLLSNSFRRLSVKCLNMLESSDVYDSSLRLWRAWLVVQPFSTRDLVLEAALSGRSLGCLSPRARDRKWSPKRHCHSECFLSSRARNQQEGPRRRRHQRRLARRPKNTTQCVAMMAKHRLPQSFIRQMQVLTNLATQFVTYSVFIKEQWTLESKTSALSRLTLWSGNVIIVPHRSGYIAVAEWDVTFGTARRRLGGSTARPGPSSPYQT